MARRLRRSLLVSGIVMRLRVPRPRFSLGLLLATVVLAALVLAVRQAVYVPVAARSALRHRLEEGGVKVGTEAPAPSWRDWLFRPEDLLEVTDVEAVEGKLPTGAVASLPRFPRLRSVKLRDCDLSDRDARSLGGIAALTTLDIVNTRIGDEGLAALADSPIEDLELRGTRVTGAAIPTIATMRRLRRLVLPLRVEPDSLAPLAVLDRLSILDREPRSDYYSDPFTPDRLPPALYALPLTEVGVMANPRSPSAMLVNQAIAPKALEPSSHAEPGPVPPPPGLRLRSVSLGPDTPPDFLTALSRQSDISSLELNARSGVGPKSDVSVLDGLPRIGALTLHVGSLDASTLRRLLNRPGLTSLTLRFVGRLEMTAEEFTDTLLDGGAVTYFYLAGPWDFDLLPGAGRIARGSPIATVVFERAFSDELFRTFRQGGVSVWPGPPPAPRLIDVTLTANPPPAWMIEAAASRGDWFDVEPTGPGMAFPEDLPPLAERLPPWIACPRTAAVRVLARGPDDGIDPSLWRSLVESPHLATVQVSGDVTEEQVLALMARPTLRSLQVASAHLTPAIVDRIGDFPHLEWVHLVAPGFGEDLCARFPRPPGSNGLPRITPDSPPAERRTVVVSTPYLSAAGPAATPVHHLGVGTSVAWREALARRSPDLEFAELSTDGGPPPEGLLERFPRLRHLSVRPYARARGPFGPWLAAMDGRAWLESLSVGWLPPDRAPDDLAWTADLPDLTTLAITSGPVACDGLSTLARCPRLARLGIGRIVGDDSARPHDTTFLRNGAVWRVLIAPDLRMTGDDLATLADQGGLETLVVDAVRIDLSAVPAIETLLAGGADLRLLRADLDTPTVDRLRQAAKAGGGSFGVVSDDASFGSPRGNPSPIPASVWPPPPPAGDGPRQE